MTSSIEVGYEDITHNRNRKSKDKMKKKEKAKKKCKFALVIIAIAAGTVAVSNMVLFHLMHVHLDAKEISDFIHLSGHFEMRYEKQYYLLTFH